MNNKLSSYQWLEIGAWTCLALGIISNGDLCIVGAILGYFLKKHTGKVWPFYINLAVVVFIFVISFLIGFISAL